MKFVLKQELSLYYKYKKLIASITYLQLLTLESPITFEIAFLHYIITLHY